MEFIRKFFFGSDFPNNQGRVIWNLVPKLKCLSKCLQSSVSFNSTVSLSRSSFLLGDGIVNEFITFQSILNLDSQLGYFTSSSPLSVEPLPSPSLSFSRIYWAVWNWDRGTLWQFNTFAHQMEFSVWTPPKGCPRQATCHINLVKYSQNETVFMVPVLWSQSAGVLVGCTSGLKPHLDVSMDCIKWLVVTHLKNRSEKIVRLNRSQESAGKAVRILKGC